MTTPTFTSPPTAPARSDAPATFISRADAFIAWFATFWAELTAGVTWFNATAAAVDADAAATATDRGLAQTAATAAAASAASALAAPGTNATSSTSATIGTGAQTLTIQTGKSYARGMWVQAADSAAPATNYMAGIVTNYDSVTGQLDFTVSAGFAIGSGTKTAWSVTITGKPTDIAAVMFGKQAIPVMAGAMISRTTNGPSASVLESSTNKVMRSTLDFDASTIEYAQFTLPMPKSWNEGTVTFVPIWSHGSTTTNFGVSWGLQAVAISDGDALDAAFGTAQYSNDTGGVTDKVYFGPESAAITIAGTPQAGDLVVFQILRKADDGTNDTLAVDAKLIGFVLYITTDAGTDA